MKATVKTTHLKEAFDHVKRARATTVADRVAFRVFEGGLYLYKYGGNIYTSAEVDCEDWAGGQCVTDNVADLVSAIKEEYLEISATDNSVIIRGEHINIVRPLVSDDISDQVLRVDWPTEDDFVMLKGERYLESAIDQTGIAPAYDNVVFLSGMAIAISFPPYKSHYCFSDDKLNGAIHINYARLFSDEGFAVCLDKDRTFFRKYGQVKLRAVTPSTIDIDSGVMKNYEAAKVVYGSVLPDMKDKFREGGDGRWVVVDASELSNAISMSSYFKMENRDYAFFSLAFDARGLVVSSEGTGENSKFSKTLSVIKSGDGQFRLMFSQKNFSLLRSSGAVLLEPNDQGTIMNIYHPIIDVLQVIFIANPTQGGGQM